MPGPSVQGPGGAGMGGGWGDINTHIDINTNIDIRIIINMNIEDYKRSYLLFIRYSRLGIPYWVFHIGYSLLGIPYQVFPMGYSVWWYRFRSPKVATHTDVLGRWQQRVEPRSCN